MKKEIFYNTVLFLSKNIFFVIIFILIICLFSSYFVFHNYIALPLEKEYFSKEEPPKMDTDNYDKVLEIWEDKGFLDEDRISLY